MRDTDFLDYFPLAEGNIPSSTTKIQSLPHHEDSRKNAILVRDGAYSATIAEKDKNIKERKGKYYRSLDEDVDPTILRDKLYELVATSNYKFRDLCEAFSPAAKDPFYEVFRRVQEDAFLLTQRADGGNYISKAALFLPNDWGAEQAIGRSFEEAHSHIPRIKSIMPDPSKFFKMLLKAKQPFERVGAVNFRVSPDFNRHIAIPEEIRCLPFDPANPSLWCRFERQVAIPLPELNSVLLTVKTYQFDCDHPDQLKKNCIIAAIENLNTKAHAYEFLAKHQKEILEWLKK